MTKQVSRKGCVVPVRGAPLLRRTRIHSIGVSPAIETVKQLLCEIVYLKLITSSEHQLHVKRGSGPTLGTYTFQVIYRVAVSVATDGVSAEKQEVVLRVRGHSVVLHGASSQTTGT
jgi:hypothetical protein